MLHSVCLSFKLHAYTSVYAENEVSKLIVCNTKTPLVKSKVLQYLNVNFYGHTTTDHTTIQTLRAPVQLQQLLLIIRGMDGVLPLSFLSNSGPVHQSM